MLRPGWLMRFRHFLPLCGALLLFQGCGSQPDAPLMRKYIESREVMGTLATITLITNHDALARTAMDSAFAFLDVINVQMNPRSEESEIFAVNAAAHTHAVPVSAATYHVLKEALRYSALSGGAIDVTVGPLLHLWKECAQGDRLPSEDEIAEARGRVGSAQVKLDPVAVTVRFRATGMRVDLGGIAKGFAIDGAVAAAQNAGITAGIVEVGGDLRCFGHIPRALVGRPARGPVRGGSGSPGADLGGLLCSEPAPSDPLVAWPLGVQSPFADELLGKIRVPAGAVATSGHYQRHVTIEGRRFSHIVDPRTGWPVESPASVTVLAPDALTADALATAITVLGADQGLALAEEYAGVDALVVAGNRSAPEMRMTSGFPRIEGLE